MLLGLSRISCIALLSFAAVTSAGFATPAKRSVKGSAFHGDQNTPSKGYFISIDGLNPLHLQVLLDQGKLTAPHGFKWLQDHTLRIKRLESVYTTLTAASHISTITCSTPAKHGILANNYFKDGKNVSGYTSEFRSEALWEAAKRQNKKVISLAYVGADGLSPRREADYGIGYPENKYLGRAQTLTWKLADLPPASGWVYGATQQDQRDPTLDPREQIIEIAVNLTTDEKLTVQALLVPKADGKTTIYLDTDKDLTNGSIGELQLNNSALPTYVHHYFTETKATSALKDFKRTVFFRALPAPTADQVSLYVSASSYNNAHPVAFREALDTANLVWPNYGVSSDKLRAAEKIESNAIFDRFLTNVANFTKSKYPYDIVLFYQPLIDTLGHSYESKLPLPFNPNATDDISVAYVRAFQIVDQNLSDLLGDMRPQDIVALMGDHGMDPIQKSTNVAALLPQEMRDKIDVIASGTLVQVYPKQTNQAGQIVVPTAEQIAAADAVGQELYNRMKDLQFEGQPVLGTAHRAAPRTVYGAEDASIYGSDWQFGDAVWTFTGANHFWLRYIEIDTNIFSEPPAYGMHGNFVNLPSMDTTGFIGGPGIRRGSIERNYLLNMLPTFTKLMDMEAPRDCMGTSIIGAAQN